MSQLIFERMTMESTALAPSTPNFQVIAPPERVHVVLSGGTTMFQRPRERMTRSLTALAPLTMNIFFVSLRFDAPELALCVDDIPLHFICLALKKTRPLLMAGTPPQSKRRTTEY